MYKCTPLYVPSNLEETELHIGISPGFSKKRVGNQSKLYVNDHGHDETYRFEGFTCFIWAENVRTAQIETVSLSRQLEKHPYHSIQSDRLYFLPLFAQVGYSISITQKRHHERPVIRVAYYPNDPVRTWNCEIYTSSLVQLQEVLFDHERNLLKKRLQVLNQQRARK